MAISADQLFGTGQGGGGNVLLPPGGYGASAPSAGAGTLPSGGGGINMPPGIDIMSLIGNMGSSVSGEEITKALSLQMQPTPLQMPSYFTRQIPDPSPVQLDRTPRVGAGAARGQGIANAVSASIGALAQFKAIRDRNTQAFEAEKVGRYMQAQEGIDQANSVLQTATPGSPEYTAAKKALDTNTALRDGMLADKKFEKLIEKGFNVSLTDPSQNKTPEHGIVQKGIGLFNIKKQMAQRAQDKIPLTPQQAAAAGQRFQASRPVMLGPNQYLMQQIQMKLGLDQARQAMMKEMINYQKDIDVAKLNQGFDLLKTQARGEYDLKVAQAKIQQEYGLKDYESQLRMLEEYNKVEVNEGNKSNVMKALAAENESYARTVASGQHQIEDMDRRMQQEIDAKSTGYQDRVLEIRRQQDAIRDSLNALNTTHSFAQQFWKLRLTGIPGAGDTPTPDMSGPHVGAGTGITPGGGGTSGTGGAGAGTGAAKPTGATSERDIDPRTRKPWDRSISSRDRALIADKYKFWNPGFSISNWYDSLSRILSGDWNPRADEGKEK